MNKSILGLGAGVLALVVGFASAGIAQDAGPGKLPAINGLAIKEIPLQGTLIYQANDETLKAALMLELHILDVPVCSRGYGEGDTPPKGYELSNGESVSGIFDRFVDTNRYVYSILRIERFRESGVVCSVFEYSYTRTDSGIPIPATKKK
jgi:hypothetical protein